MRSKITDTYWTLFFLLAGFLEGVVHTEKLCFPENFEFGVATAAYQIEGAWNVSGKSESIWDRYTHEHPEYVFGHKNGDVADDSYHLFKEDVRLLKELGVSYYRFSISWARIYSDVFANKINQDGVRYYNALIDELLKNSIQPLVTMYHWDLPQALQDLGGWTNPIIADYFVDYAKLLFQVFGDRVEDWITFNEPLSFCHDGYGGMDAPGHRSSGFEDYLCAHNVLRAHGMTYRLYKDQFLRQQKGFVTITLDFAWFEPASDSDKDKEAAERARQFMFGWFAHPIFSKEGDYPPIMRQRIDEISQMQNYSWSRLPHFTKTEIDMIRGSFDYLGLNHYTTYLVSHSDHVGPEPSFADDAGITSGQDPKWPKSNSTWLRVVPWGFRKVLQWVKTTYDNPTIVITENGISSTPGLNDTQRVNYLRSYLEELLKAVTEDKCDIRGYTHWSLIDNFEWLRGYSERFGLYEVDYKSTAKTRTARISAEHYKNIISSRCLT